MPWLETHLGSLEEAVGLANRFHWNMTVHEGNGYWSVYGGEKLLLLTDAKETVDAFLYGMGLAYGGIPSPWFEQLVEETRDYFE